MKYLILTAVALLASTATNAQNVGINTTTPHPSSELDVSSTSKGFLAPRMTAAQKTAIASPATGLLIYQTDATAGFYVFDGAAWIPVSNAAPGSAGWGLTGNAATATDFIGTTNNQPLRFRVNNQNAGFIGLGSNTAIGVQSLDDNTSGTDNTALGYYALRANTTGNSNTANGYFSLRYNTTGSDNTPTGRNTLFSNTGGSNNTATGADALYSNTEGSNNTANGFEALYANTTGSDNTALGNYTLRANQTGSDNVAIGDSALAFNVTHTNTALGSKALRSNTLGNWNTATGADALYSNTIGYSNTANGIEALYANTTGHWNTAIGSRALRYNTTGRQNTAIGTSTMSNNITGSYNTAVGESASITNLSNAGAFGYAVSPSGDNRIRLGNSFVTGIETQAGLLTTSDARVKKNIAANVPGIAFIKELKPVTYNFDIRTQNRLMGIEENQKREDGKAINEDYPGKYDIEQIKFSGFLAQEVEAAAKKVGYDFSGVDIPKEENGLYAIRYSDFVVPMVKAIQEQQEIIEALKKEVEELKNKMKD